MSAMMSSNFLVVEQRRMLVGERVAVSGNECTRMTLCLMRSTWRSLGRVSRDQDIHMQTLVNRVTI